MNHLAFGIWHLTLFIIVLFVNNAWALPPQIEADRLLLQAKAALDAKDYDTAILSLEKAETLNVKLPDTFNFHVGKAYGGAKKWEKARAAFEKYLNQTGTKGKFYREGLEGYNQADIEIGKDREYSDAMVVYEREMKPYNEQYEIYKVAKDKCDYARSDKGHRESCDNWAYSMKGSWESKQEVAESCYKNSHDGNADFLCRQVPERPEAPNRPSHKP